MSILRLLCVNHQGCHICCVSLWREGDWETLCCEGLEENCKLICDFIGAYLHFSWNARMTVWGYFHCVINSDWQENSEDRDWSPAASVSSKYCKILCSPQWIVKFSSYCYRIFHINCFPWEYGWACSDVTVLTLFSLRFVWRKFLRQRQRSFSSLNWSQVESSLTGIMSSIN